MCVDTNISMFLSSFQLFTRPAARLLFPNQRLQRWAFDVELLYLCKKYGFKIREIPTIWHDQADSKLRVMRSGMRMLGSLFVVRFNHMRR